MRPGRERKAARISLPFPRLREKNRFGMWNRRGSTEIICVYQILTYHRPRKLQHTLRETAGRPGTPPLPLPGAQYQRRGIRPDLGANMASRWETPSQLRSSPPARRVPGLAECVARRAGRGRVSPPLYLSLRDARGIVVLHVRPTPRNSYTMGTPSFARCSGSPTPDSWRRCGKPTAPAGRITSRTAVAPLDLPAARESEADGARALEQHSLHERVGDEFEVRALRRRPQIGARGVGAAPAAAGLLAPADAVGMAARKGAALSRSPGVLITDGTGWRADAPGGASERYRLPAGLRVRIAPENKRRARHDAGVGADERHVGAPPVCTDLSTLRSWVNPA